MVEARSIVEYAPMYQLLSDTNTAQGSILKANPQLHFLCRLTILLYIHSIFLEHQNSLADLKRENRRLRKWLRDEILDRFTSIESPTVLIFRTKDQPEVGNQDQALRLLQMMMVAKRLSRRTPELLLTLSFWLLIREEMYAPRKSSLLG